MTLGGRVASALKWATLAQACQRLVSWTIALIVIRLLSPEDYGLVAISMIVINVVGILEDLGLNAALIQRRRLEPHIAPKVYGAVLLTSVLAFLVVQAAAEPIAAFYDDLRIEPITRILSLTLVLGAVSSVPTALLLREVEFRIVSLIEIGRTMLSSLLVLWLAWTGWGVWALVYGNLAGSVLGALGILAVTRFSLRPDFRLAGIRPELRFGSVVMTNGLLSALNQNVPALLIGRLLGITPLGFFEVANNIAKMPVRALLRPTARVSFPAVARLQEDLARIGRFCLHMSAHLLLILLPICWGLAVLSEEFVALVLGARWADVAPILAVIALYVPLRAVSRPLQSALDGIGRPEVGLVNLLTIMLCIVPAIIAGAHWGLIGVSVAWCVGQLVAMLVNLRRTLPVFGLPWRALAGAVGPVILAAAAMCIGVWLARQLLGETLPVAARTGVLVGIGVLLYIGATLLLNRRAAVAALSALRS